MWGQEKPIREEVVTMRTLVIVVAAVVLVAAYVALMALVGSCLNLHGRPPAPRADRTEGK